MVYLDTSALVRFFTKDDLVKAKKVRQLLLTKKCFVPSVVFPELEYVLRNQYGLSRDRIASVFQILISQRNATSSSFVRFAVKIYVSTRLDMADCIIAAQSASGELASFDKDLLSADAVKPYWKDAETSSA